jgi:L-threonylcarbamoyladenylate synthase
MKDVYQLPPDKLLIWEDKNAVLQVQEALEKGSVLVCSTDTVLGFLANATHEGRQKLDAIKGRSEKPYLLLISSASKLTHFVDMPLGKNRSALSILAHCWPAPLTLIMNAKKDIPDYLKSSNGTIALRVPDHRPLLELLAHFNALFSTSANYTGKPVPETPGEIEPSLLKEVAYIVLDESAERASVASTIIDCTTDTIKMVREGAFTRKDIEHACGLKID